MIDAFMKDTGHYEHNNPYQYDIKHEISEEANWSNSSIENIDKINFFPTAGRLTSSPIITNEKHWKTSP